MMRTQPLVMLLATLACPTWGWASTSECPALRDAKRAYGGGEGTFVLEMDTLFKCYADADSFDGALAGLAGTLAKHHKRAYGIVTMGDDDYFAFVAAPYNVSTPAFYEHHENYYACVTVQRATKAADDSATGSSDADSSDDADASGWMAHAAVLPEALPASRLLQATIEQESVEPGSSIPAPSANDTVSHSRNVKSDESSTAASSSQENGDSSKPSKSQDSAAQQTGTDNPEDLLPLQSRNPSGLRPPQPPPLGNTPAGMPEAQSTDAGNDKQETPAKETPAASEK